MDKLPPERGWVLNQQETNLTGENQGGEGGEDGEGRPPDTAISCSIASDRNCQKGEPSSYWASPRSWACHNFSKSPFPYLYKEEWHTLFPS